MGANRVKEAVPVLSTHRCLKRLPALADCRAGGSMAFTPWSTPHHTPAQGKGCCLVSHDPKVGCWVS